MFLFSADFLPFEYLVYILMKILDRFYSSMHFMNWHFNKKKNNKKRKILKTNGNMPIKHKYESQ